jgi:hypothetical protein
MRRLSAGAFAAAGRRRKKRAKMLRKKRERMEKNRGGKSGSQDAVGDTHGCQCAMCKTREALREAAKQLRVALGAFERNDAINWDDLRRAAEKAEELLK